MISRFSAFVVGVGLCFVGVQLASVEVDLLPAREAAHEASMRGQRIEPIRIANAIRKFDQQITERFDIWLPKMRLERKLAEIQGEGEHRGEMFQASVKRAQSFARKVATIAPLNSEAWCALAQLAAQRRQHQLVPRMLQQCYLRSQWELRTIGPRVRLTMAYWPNVDRHLQASAMNDLNRIIRRPESKHYAMKLMTQLATEISPEHESILRELIAQHEPPALARFDRAVQRYRRAVRERVLSLR